MGFADASIVEWINKETQQKVLYMFYVGFSDFVTQGNYQQVSDSTLGMAISYNDGVTWEKSQNNPFSIHQSTPSQISSVDARVIGSRIHLWIGDVYDNHGGIGYYYYEPDIEPH